MLNPSCREPGYWPVGENACYLPPAARCCELHLPELHSTYTCDFGAEESNELGGVGENREDKK
jgi:hypothetical protein